MWIGMGALLLSKIIAGAVNPAVLKLSARAFSPVPFIAVRFILATLIILPFYLRERKKPKNLPEIKRLTLFSLLFLFNTIFYIYGIALTTIIMSEVLYAMLPVFVIILSYFLTKERLTKNKLIGFAISLVGFCILLQQLLTTQAVHTFGTVWGNMLVICAVISWSFYTVFSKPLTTTYSPVTTTLFSFMITAAAAIVFLPFHQLFHFPVSFSLFHGENFLLLSLSIGAAIGNFFLFQLGIHKTTPIISSFFQYLSPFFALLTAIPVFGERLTIPLIIGGGFVLAGVFYATTYSYVRNITNKKQE